MTALVFALLLDAIFGEPRAFWDRWPHPAILMGRVIGWADQTLNIGKSDRLFGVLLIMTLVAGAGLAGRIIELVPGIWLDVAVAAVLLAHRSLVDHVTAVAEGLGLSLGEGRRAVSNIVGRDTQQMDQPAISRSAIESGAENFSDGVVAPAFWFMVAGVPGILIYKFINTADSMIGYQTPRHAKFGWAAARLDDVLNLIPARLTAALIWLVSSPKPSWTDLRRDAARHRSPNAGWPEAAMARAVGVALAGPRSYHGSLRDFPFVNAGQEHQAGPRHIHTTTQKLWQAWGLLLAFCIALALL